MPILKKNHPPPKETLNDSFLALLDKDEDWTSFDVVNKLRSIIGIRKIGHAGTLDPFATGLLIIGIGKATKELKKYADLPKEYQALVRFGIETNTQDRTGEIISSCLTEKLDESTLYHAVEKMTGQMLQIPPMFSAKKVKGQRLYKLARQNQVINRQPVAVHIYQSQIIAWNNPFLSLGLKVSKGTYIRAYASDLGKLVGCGAHLSALRRIKIGDFDVKDSYTLAELKDYWTN